MQLDQLGEALGDGIDQRIQVVDDERRQTFLAVPVQRALEGVEGFLRGLHQRLDPRGKLPLGIDQVGVQVCQPEPVDLGADVAHLVTRLRIAEHAAAGLVRRIDDLHRVQVGDQLEVTQRHDAVQVHGVEPGHAALLGIEPGQPDHQAGRKHGPDQNQQAGTDCQLLHHSFFSTWRAVREERQIGKSEA